MMRTLAASALALMISVPVFAEDLDERGRITINGTGEATAEPEFAKLNVVVTSICYDTSVAAKNANAALANQLLNILKGFATDPLDKVTASGGPNVRRTESIVVGDEVKVLCELKWRATNTLTLKMKDWSRLAEIQDSLLAAIDQAGGVDPNVTAQTYAELGQPSFHVTPETLNKLRREAQIKAYDDAKLQYETFASRCAFVDPRLTRIEPPEYATFYKAAGRAFDSAAGEPTPIIPDEISVTASWQFVWTFEPTAGCPLPL